jgi:hypothetical protein
MGMIINPYRFANVAWTPPNAVLWYYGALTIGGKWADRIGSNHGTFQGGASAAADGVECSTTKYVSLGYSAMNAIFQGNDVISMAFWAKVTRTDYGDRSIFGVYNAGYANGFYGFFLDTSATPDRVKWRIVNNYGKYKGYDITDGNWHHFAAVYDNANDVFSMYINGVKQTALTNISNTFVSLPQMSSNFIMGYYADYIDDCIISNTAWSDDDVADIYNNSPATHKA